MSHSCLTPPLRQLQNTTVTRRKPAILTLCTERMEGPSTAPIILGPLTRVAYNGFIVRQLLDLY